MEKHQKRKLTRKIKNISMIHWRWIVVLLLTLSVFSNGFLYFSQESNIKLQEQKFQEQRGEIIFLQENNVLLERQIDGLHKSAYGITDDLEKMQSETEKQFVNMLPTLQITENTKKTDDWSVYENEKLGFKFKIPSFVSVDRVIESGGNEIAGSFTGFKNNGKDFIEMNIYENFEDESLWHHVHRGGNYVGPAQFKSFIGGKIALVDYYHENEKCDHELCHGSYIQFVIENENNFYVIKFLGDERLNSMEEAILLSFEFIE